MTDEVKKPRTRTTTIYDKRPSGWRRVRTEEVAIPEPPDPADDGPEVSYGPERLREMVVEEVREERERTLAAEAEFCRKVGVDV